MINRIINNKITWIVLGSLIVGLLIILVIPKKDDDIYLDKEEADINNLESEENIMFSLVGDEEISLYVGDEYEELGVVALLNDETNLASNVEIDGNVDTNVVGEYKIIYTLTYKNIEKKLERKINEIEINLDKINIKLNGDETVYLNVNEEYTELGATATYNERDLTSEIKIENNIDTTIPGEYTVIYKVNNTNIERKIIVFDIDKLFNIDKENYIINVTLNDNFNFIRLPNGTISQNKVVSYKAQGSGNYLFILYTKDNKKYEKLITITKEEVESLDPPIGTCEAVLKDSKTTVTVKSESQIEKYIYNGVESSGSIYNVDKYLRNVTVKLIGKNQKETEIKCNIKMETMPVNKPSGKLAYSEESDTLKVYIKKTDGWVLSYIWVKDANRQLLNVNLVGEKSGTTVDKIVKKAIGNNYKDKIVLGFNTGDWLVKKNNKYTYNYPFDIKNGQVINTTNKEKRPFIYYISDNNKLSYVELKGKSTEEKKKLYQKIIDDGAYNTFRFQPTLVENGVARKTRYDKNSTYDYNAYRQGICQIDANNFILVTSGSATTEDAVAFGKYMQKLGCITAFNLDGGGSTQTAFKKKGTNTVELIIYKRIKGSVRSNHSAMYFTEIE